jgi:nucleotide-binding universal stress UspA family protein
MYSKIMLPVDLNEEESWSKALPTALTLCRSFNASLHLVTVLPDYNMPIVGSYFPKGGDHQGGQETRDRFDRYGIP